MWSEVARARVPGPLAPFADGFRAELDRLGYRLNSRESKVNEMSRLSRWLEGRGLGPGTLTMRWPGRSWPISRRAGGSGRRCWRWRR
jgi:hypothetical protein